MRSFLTSCPDYNKYADIQQAIYIELLRRLDREKIQLGFPLRSLTLRSS